MGAWGVWGRMLGAASILAAGAGAGTGGGPGAVVSPALLDPGKCVVWGSGVEVAADTPARYVFIRAMGWAAAPIAHPSHSATAAASSDAAPAPAARTASPWTGLLGVCSGWTSNSPTRAAGSRS